MAVFSPPPTAEVSSTAHFPAAISPVHGAPWLVSTATGLGTSPTTVLPTIGECPALPLPAPTSWQGDRHKSIPVWAQLQFNQLGVPHPSDNSGGGHGEDAYFPGHCLREGKPLPRMDSKPSSAHFKCHTQGWGRCGAQAQEEEEGSKEPCWSVTGPSRRHSSSSYSSTCLSSHSRVPGSALSLTVPPHCLQKAWFLCHPSHRSRPATSGPQGTTTVPGSFISLFFLSGSAGKHV